MADDTTPIPVDPVDEFATTGPAGSPAGATAERSVHSTYARSVQADSLDASLSAIAVAKTTSLRASGSAVGLANVSGDADVGGSAVGMMTTKGRGTIKQSYVQNFVGAEHVELNQAATAATIARTVTFERSASLISLSNDTEVRSGVVGVLISGRSNISENARVILTGRALAVVALALLGGLGLIAIAVVWGAAEVATKLPRIDLSRVRERR